MAGSSKAITIALAIAGIALAVLLGVITAQLTSPSVGINDEPPSISEELVDKPAAETGARPRHAERRKRHERPSEPADSEPPIATVPETTVEDPDLLDGGGDGSSEGSEDD